MLSEKIGKTFNECGICTDCGDDVFYDSGNITIIFKYGNLNGKYCFGIDINLALPECRQGTGTGASSRRKMLNSIDEAIDASKKDASKYLKQTLESEKHSGRISNTEEIQKALDLLNQLTLF